MKKGMIKATGPFERVVHWCLALSCLFLCITGMGMMYHSLNFIGTIFGGMGNLKVIHNYTGIFFGVSLLFAIVMWWKEAGLFSFPEDGQWFAAAGGYLWHVDNMPEVGKYNPGQKMFFLAVACSASPWLSPASSCGSRSAIRSRWSGGCSPACLGLCGDLRLLLHPSLPVTIGAPGSAPAMFPVG